ncbi:GNAT family N-acetyltransferase [Novosphingobium sp.]|uniref:GNAT family N-acetyltransferase n=1 Tax=Novosphingobium sp. TaxID=1874826 RepID=UPI003B52802A
MFIRSERLFLRPVWAEDRDELVALTRDELTAQAWIGHAHPPRYPRCLITLPDQADGGAHVIGTIGIGQCDRLGDGAAALHVWVAPERRRQGFGKEAVLAVLALLRSLGHDQIVARHIAASGPARQLLTKLGFVPTGPMQLALRLAPAAGNPFDAGFSHAA